MNIEIHKIGLNWEVQSDLNIHDGRETDMPFKNRIVRYGVAGLTDLFPCYAMHVYELE